MVKVLEEIWEICGRICSRRLHSFLPEMVNTLERHGEMEIKDETKEQLLNMSRATIDRSLKKVRFNKPNGLSTTKPGTLLKKAIPVRIRTEWDDTQPGFVEIDLIAHCGQSADGHYINTLTAVDISTGWTECFGIYQKTQKAVFEDILELCKRMPFSLQGIDSDNGSEFINGLLYDYCQQEKITFTHSRPYKKYDQAHIEQKNWSIVRRTLGYDRFDTEDKLVLFLSIYADLRFLYEFLPTGFQVRGKVQIDGKLKKPYDIADTLSEG